MPDYTDKSYKKECESVSNERNVPDDLSYSKNVLFIKERTYEERRIVDMKMIVNFSLSFRDLFLSLFKGMFRMLE